MTPTGAIEAAYLEAARVAVEQLEQRRVGDKWDDPSALPQMTTGALAAHLASEVLMVRDVWRDPASWSEEEPIGLLEHYRRSAWVEADIDDEANVGIRQGAERDAADGHEALAAEVRRALEQLSQLAAGPDRPRNVRMPWWSWSLAWEDFLVTRMMEITVHSDDLAVSVDTEPPALSPAVLEPVLSLLVGVAVLRHGQAPVVRALSRAERAPASIAAF